MYDLVIHTIYQIRGHTVNYFYKNSIFPRISLVFFYSTFVKKTVFVIGTRYIKESMSLRHFVKSLFGYLWKLIMIIFLLGYFIVQKLQIILFFENLGQNIEAAYNISKSIIIVGYLKNHFIHRIFMPFSDMTPFS